MHDRRKAALKGWAKLSPKQRSERMQYVAIQKHQQMTEQERHDHAVKMIQARWEKKRLLDKENKESSS